MIVSMSIERPSFLSEKYQNKIKVEWQKRSTQQNKWGLSCKVSGGVADFPQMKLSERKGKKSRFNSSSILAIMVINIVIITILNITLNARTKWHQSKTGFMPQVEAWEQHRATTAPAELIWEDATWKSNNILLISCYLDAHLGGRHLRIQHLAFGCYLDDHLGERHVKVEKWKVALGC